MKILVTETQYNKIIEEQILAGGPMVSTVTGFSVFPKILKGLDPKSYPLHIYNTLRFSSMNTSPLTEKEIKPSSMKTLIDVICQKSVRMKTCDPSKWAGNDKQGKPNKNRLSYHDFTTEYSKSPNFGGAKFNYHSQPEFLQEWILTLGQTTITKSGSGWVLTDMYNFDNIMKTNPSLKTGNYLKSTLNIFKGIFNAVWGAAKDRSLAGAAAGMEEVLSQYHNFGYKGFPVKINVPMGHCKCSD